MPTRRAAALLAAALAAAASLELLPSCRRVPVRLRPGPPLDVQAVAVYPCVFRWDEPAHRSFELSEALALQAVQTGRYSVFGPGEFKLVRGSAANPFVGSDIALQLADRGLSPMAALVFRPTLEKREQSELKQVFDERGRPRGAARVEAARIVARLEVFHSSSREVVADADAAVEIDPLAARDATDPMPEVTAALRRMMAALLERIAERAPGRPLARPFGFEYLFSSKASLDFALEGRPALSESLSRLDPLEQDVAVESRLRFFVGELDDATIARLRRMPGGLYVTRLLPEAPAGLQEGDLIVAVNGEPAMPQTLQRALRAALPHQPIALKVRRQSGLVELSMTPSPPPR